MYHKTILYVRKEQYIKNSIYIYLFLGISCLSPSSYLKKMKYTTGAYCFF
jgi:hypothetical protein